MLKEILNNEIVQLCSYVISFLGTICIVYAYLAIEKGWVTRTTPKYYYVNLTGAFLLTISLMVHFNLGGFLIEIFWIWISLSGLKRIKKGKRQDKGS